MSNFGPGNGQKQLYVLAGGGQTNSVSRINGGDYVWRAEATSWNAATVTLQFLGLDGTTWSNARNSANTADVTLTANGQVPIGIGQGSTIRLLVTGGPPSNLNSTLAGLS